MQNAPGSAAGVFVFIECVASAACQRMNMKTKIPPDRAVHFAL